MNNTLEVTAEAKAALRHKGPSTAQLVKMVNGSDETSMPSSRHVRWMAAQIIIQRGIDVPGANSKNHF